MVDECYALASKWSDADTKFAPKDSDISAWTSSQSVVFLERLQQASKPLSADLIELMNKTYHYGTSSNVELSSRFLVLGLKAGDKACCAPAAELLGKVGRMKFVRPLYRHLVVVDRRLAEETFKRNREFYHPICRGMVEKDLFGGGKK